MKELIEFLEKNNQNKMANELKLLISENEILKKTNDNLESFSSFVIQEIKQRYSKDRIISSIVLEAKKRKFLS
jgi:hypothetical protein